MPYIHEGDRLSLDINKIVAPPVSSGGLNYLITKMIVAFLGTDPHYADFNAAIGALECAKLELYRRLIGPYEDLKIEENGDVY